MGDRRSRVGNSLSLSFLSRKLLPPICSSVAEEKCISAVTRKFITASVRATARFGEAQADAARKAAATTTPGTGAK